VPKDVIDELLSEAEKQKVKPKDDEELRQTMPMLLTQLKALVARDLWDMNQYFDIINEQNHIVQRALQIIQP
jgi:carboxyl-terminal processing protease